VLRELGSLLRAQVREADIACRYGGEEFALIMPDASLEVARARAERLRASIGQLEVQYGGRSLGRITASLGVAEVPRHGPNGESAIRMADAAMYRAKQAGRDQVQVAEMRLDAQAA
jgi:diguanylate cyclase (GGDEF)-like protein